LATAIWRRNDECNAFFFLLVAMLAATTLGHTHACPESSNGLKLDPGVSFDEDE